MFDEDDLLPISALAHLFFCQRRAALIHIEGVWEENLFTAEGRILHEAAHEPTLESRGELRIARGLRLRSLRLGLSGKADVVEFHRRAQADSPPAMEGGLLPTAIQLPGVDGFWQPFPVEYKRGRLRREEGYEVQLCAQALSLEEMLGVAVPVGAVFYGQPRKRLEVAFGEELRRETETAAARLHELLRARNTPPARYEKKCDSCSLLALCMPKTTGGRKSVERYLAGMLEYGGLPLPSDGSPPRDGAD
jgi:CRISPR-associated exonuclease Cas4